MIPETAGSALAVEAKDDNEKHQAEGQVRARAALVCRATPSHLQEGKINVRAAAQDGLPTAVVWVRNRQRAIKLDSCARYSIAGSAWMKCGVEQRRRPPVKAIEGVSGTRVPVTGIWRFRMRNQYDQEFIVEALMVPACEDTFLLGTDFMASKAAVMDFQTGELTWNDAHDAFIVPFSTWQDGAAMPGPAKVRLASGRCFKTLTNTTARIAVSGQDGETGVFLPAARDDGLMVPAVVATVRGGCIEVPIANSTAKSPRLPTREELGTWIPYSEEMEILGLADGLSQEKVAQWVEGLAAHEQDGQEDESKLLPEIKTGDLEPAERRLMEKLVEKYKHLTDVPTSCPPMSTTGVEHEIDTGTNAPIRLPHCRHAQAEQAVISENVKKMLADGVIEESHGAWAFPVVLVRKKDGQVRFCIDYRALNAVTHKDVYPLPRVDETLEALGGAMLFTTLDLKTTVTKINRPPWPWQGVPTRDENGRFDWLDA